MQNAGARRGRGVLDRGKDARAESLDKAVIGPDRKCPFQSGKVGRHGSGPQHRDCIRCRLSHAIAKFLGIGRRHEVAAGANEQRVAGRSTQPRQRTAHCGSAQAQPARRARHAALGEQRIQRGEKIEVHGGHRGINNMVG